MADPVFGIRSVPLGEFIGSSLAAIVQADAQAAQTTLEFIETVGFVASSESEDPGAVETGQLRMAEFRYSKLDENQEVAEFTAAVPLLSLVPIPAIQIKDAKLSFAAKITDIARESPKSRSTPADARGKTVLSASRHRLLTKPVASAGSKNEQVRGSFHFEIELSLTRADLPLGVEKILNLMDQAIRDTKSE